jgi:anti-sigma B factor antagonist
MTPGDGWQATWHYAASRPAHRGADARATGRVEGSGVTLSITRSTLAGNVVELSPSGEIDVENAYEIREAVAAELGDAHPVRIELNMQDVTFIDSVGISALVAAFQLAGVSDVRLTVTRPSRFAHRQLWVTGLLGLFGNPQPHGNPVTHEQTAVAGA